MRAKITSTGTCEWCWMRCMLIGALFKIHLIPLHYPVGHWLDPFPMPSMVDVRKSHRSKVVIHRPRCDRTRCNLRPDGCGNAVPKTITVSCDGPEGVNRQYVSASVHECVSRRHHHLFVDPW